MNNQLLFAVIAEGGAWKASKLQGYTSPISAVDVFRAESKRGFIVRSVTSPEEALARVEQTRTTPDTIETVYAL